MEYYFIGKYVNLIFKNFTKLIAYQETKETKEIKLDEYYYKYIKYKNKYLQNK
jgi:hypothetical protein